MAAEVHIVNFAGPVELVRTDLINEMLKTHPVMNYQPRDYLQKILKFRKHESQNTTINNILSGATQFMCYCSTNYRTTKNMSFCIASIYQTGHRVLKRCQEVSW